MDIGVDFHGRVHKGMARQLTKLLEGKGVLLIEGENPPQRPFAQVLNLTSSTWLAFRVCGPWASHFHSCCGWGTALLAMLITRDLSPLLEHEFVTQWDCYDNPITQLSPLTTHHSLTRFTDNLPGLEHGTQHSPTLSKRRLGCIPLACRLDNSAPEPFDPNRRDRK
jgi:hypothetical protein